MYLDRPEAVATAQPKPGLDTTTAQAGDNVEEEEEKVPDSALYEFLQPAKARSTDEIITMWTREPNSV